MNLESIRKAIETAEELEKLLEGFDRATRQELRQKSLPGLVSALRYELGRREQSRLEAFAGAPMLPGLGDERKESSNV